MKLPAYFVSATVLLSTASAFMMNVGGPAQASRRELLQAGARCAVASAAVSLPLAAGAAPTVNVTPGGVKYIVRAEGKGDRPLEGDFCVVSYVGYLNNGKLFDASDEPGRKPVAFKLGSKQVIRGWEEVIPYMRPGGEVNIVVPPELAYGKKGVCLPDSDECLVPPNETLKFTLKLERTAISP
ncbi:unnamed protein product [Chrysoparadoxa australica]